MNIGDRLPELLEQFEELRHRCPALREVYLPDDVWPDVRAQAAAPGGGVGHRSHLFYAFTRGNLERVTKPIHHFLLCGQRVRDDVIRDCRRALRERWMLKDTEVKRQQKFNEYYGRVVELQVAEWLVSTGWSITGLEALGAPSDIRAKRGSGPTVSFEVKYLGQTPEVFALISRSVAAGRPEACPISVYGPPNYLQLRVYDAARQLARVDRPRIAAIVVDEQDWPNLDIPLRNGWIDWANPRFFDAPEWQRFFAAEVLPRSPQILQEIGPAIKQLDEIWIVRHHPDGYTYRLHETITVPQN